MSVRTKEEAVSAFWEAVEHTRTRSPATFEQWFSNVGFDDLTDGVLTLRAQNEFVQEWVRENFLPTLVGKLSALIDRSIQVAWIVDPVMPSSIAFGSRSEPIRPLPMPRGDSSSLPAFPAPSRGSVRPEAFEEAPSSQPAPFSQQVPFSQQAPFSSQRWEPSPRSSPPPFERRSYAPSQPPPSERPTGVESSRSHEQQRSRFGTPLSLEDLNPKQTFSSFVVGPSNQLAHAAAIAAAGGGGRRYNPLFICGGTGLGKTHLMQALAHRMRQDKPDARIIYVSAERFTNEFITALQHHRMDEFRSRYRSQCDLLLVDDIQFLAGKEQTQEEFFHTFNALHGLDRQIVVTSDKYPQHLEHLEERLVSRFSWGLVADVQVPELETRVAIVRNKAHIEGIALDDDVALYLAQLVRSNVRELEGTLIRLAAKSSLTGKVVDMAFARAELALTSTAKAQVMNVEDIQRAVCHHFRLRSTDLVSKDRHKSVAFARHVAMYLCKQRLKCSFPELGRAFGNRDHTTVMSAVRKIEAQRDTDPEVRAHLEALERKLAEG